MNKEIYECLQRKIEVIKHSEKEWDKLQEQHNVFFPKDYIAFVDFYGGGAIDVFLWIYTPWGENENINFFECAEEVIEAYKISHDEFPDDFPFKVYPENGGLLPFGGTDNGDDFYWLKTGDNPDFWRIVVYDGRSTNYYEYEMSLTDFIVGVITGDVQCEVLPDTWQGAKSLTFMNIE